MNQLNNIDETSSHEEKKYVMKINLFFFFSHIHRIGTQVLNKYAFREE